MQFLGIGFLVLIFLEIMSIVWVADWLGGATTLALMILSFVIGLVMLRRFGMSGVLLAASAARSGGNVSAYQLLWPIRYALAALMLMSPGFASSMVAAILMLPIKGKPIVNVQNHAPFGSSQSRRYDGDIIEGDYTVDESPTRSQKSYLEDKSK